uniref:UPF0160 protein MYG1, mitochondrial n=1 Tax=Globodera pallida TaxID=36090 RepID=A0A183BHG4_GLOPA
MATQSLIGTHNGKFHCDEVFACYMLKKLPMFSNHSIVRTRDPQILNGCDVVVDVGGVYDHQRMRYDHHQRDFAETIQSIVGLPFQTKLSSAGLIYAHYGKAVIGSILGLPAEDADVEKLYEQIYKKFVEAIDAIDNGINQFDGLPRYQLSSTFGSRVEHCNPAWNEETPDPEKGFQKAMAIVEEEFEQRVRSLHTAWLPARNIVLAAVHPSGKVLMFHKSGGVPWKDHFFQLEKELGLKSAGICLVLYNDSTNNTWRVQTIPVSELCPFDSRISLPWKGYRDGELEKESRIDGAIFVHANGFIGGTKTMEGALKLADETLRSSQML